MSGQRFDFQQPISREDLYNGLEDVEKKIMLLHLRAMYSKYNQDPRDRELLSNSLLALSNAAKVCAQLAHIEWFKEIKANAEHITEDKQDG